MSQRFVLLSFLVFASSAQAQTEIPYGWVNISIATYNIHAGIGQFDNQYRPDRIASVISQADADVVLMQEVDRRYFDGRSNCDDQYAVFAQLLPQYPYRSFEPKLAGTWFLSACGMFQRYEYGTMILSKVPLENYARTWVPNTGTNETAPIQKAEVVVRGLRFTVYNTHWCLSDAVRLEQASAAAQFINSTAQGMAVFFGGDLNTTDASPALQPLRNRPLYSTLGGSFDTIWSSWNFGGFEADFGVNGESDHRLRLYRWWWFNW
jgi:endonuclease/exonuclease/phosphatase family metal-dependent hydrolase